MRLVTIALRLFLPLAVLLGACVEDTTQNSSLEDHVQMYQELLCAHIEECGAEPGWDFDSCMVRLKWSADDIEEFRVLENDGIAQFDAKRGDACIEAVVLHECPIVMEEERGGIAGLWFNIPECDQVISYHNPL